MSENTVPSPGGKGQDTESPLREPVKETSGQYLFRTLKPFGCVLALLCMVSMLAFCFSTMRAPVKGYEPPESSEYYRENLDELKGELEENLFPHLEGVISCEERGNVLVIVIESESYYPTRAAIWRYYDRELFSIIDSAGQ